jgi:hypothetical protein
MEDAALVRQVAAECLRCFGSATQEHLCEKTDRALALGDDLSAQVWLDIAASVAEQMCLKLDPRAERCAAGSRSRRTVWEAGESTIRTVVRFPAIGRRAKL